MLSWTWDRVGALVDLIVVAGERLDDLLEEGPVVRGVGRGLCMPPLPDGPPPTRSLMTWLLPAQSSASWAPTS